MKVLFVSSSNSGTISPLVMAQGLSLEEFGINVIYFGIKGKGLYGYLKNIIELRHIINSALPDIIHAHYGLSAIISLIAKKNQKLVVSFMGDDLLGSSLRNGKISISSQILVRSNKLFAKYFYNHSIYKSDEMGAKLAIENKTLIPNGVDLNIFKPGDKLLSKEKLGYKLNDSLVIFVSNPTRPEKNFTLAQQAFNLAAIPDSYLIPVFNILHEDISVYYNAADVLLMTSFHEGSPNAIKEAMACNCPIVTTNVGDVKQMLDNLKGCYLTSFDPQEIADNIRRAIYYSKTIGGIAGIKRIRELGLDSESIVIRLIAVYQQVIKE